MKLSDIDIPREYMPQITKKDLKGEFEFKYKMINPRVLTPSQDERDPEKSKNIDLENAEPIIVDREGRIVDGHHRWDAWCDSDTNKIRVIVVNALIAELIARFSDKTE